MDNHATTRVDPRVVEAMLPYFDREYGNPASRTHVFGWRAEEAVTRARVQVARLIGADPKEIIFTSGATESNNLAILGGFESCRAKGDHVVTAATEHNAVLDPVEALRARGASLTVLPVDRYGRVDPDDVRRSLNGRTVLVSIMLANNEVGTIHPVAEIGRICRERGVLFHSDAAQAVGKIPVDVQALGVDLLSISAHKIYGPKGAGALFVRRRNPRVVLEPILHGGGHERGLRPGTLNVPGIVGMGQALEIASAALPEESQRLRDLRDRLQRRILERIEDVSLNGHPTDRLPHNLNLSFDYVEGEALLMALDDVAVSSGSACTSAKKEPSHVLRAMGLSDAAAATSIRFGLGRFNTQEEVDDVVERLDGAVRRLRAISPLYAAARGEAGLSSR